MTLREQYLLYKLLAKSGHVPMIYAESFTTFRRAVRAGKINLPNFSRLSISSLLDRWSCHRCSLFDNDLFF